jgi:drug/metabolite transporter (DMT)-like permease
MENLKSPALPVSSTLANRESAPRRHFFGSQGHATLVLIVVTLFWGLSFPLVKDWQEAAQGCPGGDIVSSLTLIALRMILALSILAVFSPRLFRAPSWRDHAIGTIIGGVCFGGFAFQVVGQARTTPALSAFITSLSSAWVPLVAWVFLRIAVSWVTLAGLGMGILGAACLAINGGGGMTLEGGEGLTLVSTLFFAVQILLLSHLGRTVAPGNLTVGFFAATGLAACVIGMVYIGAGPGFTAWWQWLTGMLTKLPVLRGLGLLAVFSTVLTFHWMNVYQPQISANRAALIYLLEPVFAAMFSVALGHESLTLYLFIGGSLILGGNLLVELPGWLRHRNKNGSLARQREPGPVS